MGYKLTLFANAAAIKPEVKCAACDRVLDTPICLPCTAPSDAADNSAASRDPHLVCQSCLRHPGTRKQRLFRCPTCDTRVPSEFVASLLPLSDKPGSAKSGVPNWIRVELNSLRLSCPKRCGAQGLRLADLERHYAADCGKAEVACDHEGCGRRMRREQAGAHDADCAFKRVECRVCKKSMLNKDLPGHQVKTRCHELEMKLARKQCMKQCNRDVRDHYRHLREHSLVSMQEFRRTELSHLQRMGVQGFVRREPLPPALGALGGNEAPLRRCDRCCRLYCTEINHDTACRWHGGPIIQTFGGLCLACGKPSHTRGCILSAHISSGSSSRGFQSTTQLPSIQRERTELGRAVHA